MLSCFCFYNHITIRQLSAYENLITYQLVSEFSTLASASFKFFTARSPSLILTLIFRKCFSRSLLDRSRTPNQIKSFVKLAVIRRSVYRVGGAISASLRLWETQLYLKMSQRWRMCPIWLSRDLNLRPPAPRRKRYHSTNWPNVQIILPRSKC